MLYLLNVMKHIAVNWLDLSSFSWAGGDGDTYPKVLPLQIGVPSKSACVPHKIWIWFLTGFNTQNYLLVFFQYFFVYGLRDGSGGGHLKLVGNLQCIQYILIYNMQINNNYLRSELFCNHYTYLIQQSYPKFLPATWNRVSNQDYG